MRILVRCPECARQLDAGGLEPGAQFHCQCGAVLTVPTAQGHAAAVVRCSACGAPRQEGARHCVFCGSDFTLHERDLHTVCPTCFARISDQARFCHHCAAEILPQGRAGDLTAKPCPACGGDAQLASRRLGRLPHSVLECGRCAGMWLGHDLLQSVVTTVRDKALPADLVPKAPPPPPPPTRSMAAPAASAGAFYRPCPECDKRMLRKNWGTRSGVIVDVCSAHGVWFDADELATVLRWVRDGGLERVKARQAAAASRPAPALTPAVPIAPRGSHHSFGGGWLGHALELLAWVGVEVLLD